MKASFERSPRSAIRDIERVEKADRGLLVKACQAVSDRDIAAEQAAPEEIEREDIDMMVKIDFTSDPVEPGPYGSDLDDLIPF